MSDARFARLKTDPRFRRPKNKQNRVVVDERFKSIFNEDGANSKAKVRVDKYGRKVSKTKDVDNLRRFYRLENDEGEADENAPSTSAAPDYARGEGLVESSDEEEPVTLPHASSSQHSGSASEESENEDDDEKDDANNKPIRFGRKNELSKLHDSDEDLDDDAIPEIDLDETNFEDLDAQASAYAQQYASEDDEPSTSGPSSKTTEKTKSKSQSKTKPKPAGKLTSRLAAVNLDWDHVRASHLFKIFQSVLITSSSSSTLSSSRAKLLNVRIYPSQFGKERMAKEEIEGPPVELFMGGAGKKDEEMDEEDVNEETIFQTGDADHVNNDALRKYQLERLRYYYAIATFDSPASASIAYNELDGTELERSANLFDLSYVPEDMSFEDDVFKEEAVDDGGAGAGKGLDFVTDALRHSKVKLTWDDDDNARTKVTRRALSKKEMEEQDYRAYIASDSQASSSSSSSEGEAPQVLDPTHNDADGKKNENKDGKGKKKLSKEERRAKLRSMLLDTEDLPEGWGNVSSSKDEMTVTFAPGLSSKSSKKGEEEGEKEGERENENETTLERYQRRQREKKMARKEKALGKRGNEDGESGGDGKDSKTKPVKEDDFFGADSDSDTEKPSTSTSTSKSKSKKSKDPIPTPTPLPEISSKAELSLILSNPSSAAAGPKHFDMKEVIKAEKENSGKKESRWKVKKEKRRKGKDGDHEGGEGEGEGGAGEGREDGKGFEVDVRDERFVALHDESEFAIDRSHPQFKSTNAMNALISERSRRQKEKQKSSKASSIPTQSTSTLKSSSNAALGGGGGDINSLVESIKRKSRGEGEGVGRREGNATKRRKV